MDKTPWMTWMIQHIGESEVTGGVPTAFDKMVFGHTFFGDIGNRLPPSCAATACAALEITGYKSSHNASALSFEAYGMPLVRLQYGCVCVFQFSRTDHHVTFFEKDLGEGFVECLGGNQSHYIKRTIYPLADIIAMRWPVKDLSASKGSQS